MKQALRSSPRFELSRKLKVGVLSGGASSERTISLRSGRAVNRALKAVGFSTWVLDPAKPKQLLRGLKQIDVAFIALHGRGGEDGVIQNLCRKHKVPYIGSDAAGSRKAFDKGIAKKIFESSGVPTPPCCLVTRANYRKRLTTFPVPFFVKPLCEGSSVGAFSVEDLRQSAVKLRQSLTEYGQLLVEKKIEGREFTVGILGSRALPVIELRPKRAFYDYRAKYTKGMTDYLVPAPVSKHVAAEMQKFALRAHRALGLRDFSRVDLMTDSSGKPYVLEVNTIPGFTALSLLPKAAREAGIRFEELCYRLVAMAYRRRNCDFTGPGI